jgi:hypothetical protein
MERVQGSHNSRAQEVTVSTIISPVRLGGFNSKVILISQDR